MQRKHILNAGIQGETFVDITVKIRGQIKAKSCGQKIVPL